MAEYVASNLFKNIVINDKVTPNLSTCLYCYVWVSCGENKIADSNYRIPLETLNEHFKRCPSCSKIYIVSDNLLPK